MRHRRPLAILALSLSAFAFASFGAPRPAVADDTLTFVLGTVPPLMDTLDLVAQAAGFYHEEHLVVTKVLVTNGTAALNACATSQADICPMSIESLFTGYEHGIFAQFFLARAALYTYVIAVPVDSPIRTLADFKGKTIGTHTVETIPLAGQVAVTSMLATAGLTPSDFSFAAIGFNQQALDALKSGRVDGAAFPAYELIPFQIAGVTLRTFYHPILKNVVNAGYAASPTTIRTKADALKRFSRAIVEAALFVRLNPAAAARLALQAHGEPFTDDDVKLFTRELVLWQDALPAHDPASTTIGYVPPADEAVYSKLLADYGVTKAAVPVTAILTNDFVAYANAFDHGAFVARVNALR